MPRISIIVPIYNIQNYVEGCLTSLADQTYTDFEVLCVIDGSNDYSATIAKEFAATDPRFIVFEKENGGLSSARNYGIDRAQGDILLFVDGDDTVEPELCQTVAEAFNATNSDVIIFGANVIPASEETSWFKHCLNPPKHTWHGFSSELMFSPFATPFVWRNAIRKEALEASGIRFDESLPFGEDVVFQFQLFPRVNSISSIRERLYDYQIVRTGSLMDDHRTTEKRLVAHQQIVRTILSDWQDLGLLHENAAQLFSWSIEYLTREIDTLPLHERLRIMDEANAIWHEYFADTSVTSIQVKRRCLCRGEGRIYLLYRIVSEAPYCSLECKLDLDGHALPVNAYPLNPDSIPLCNDWVVVIPSLLEGNATLTLAPDGRTAQATTVVIDYSRAATESKINYVMNRQRCARIRDFEQPLTFHRYQCRILQRFEGEDCILWRTQIHWEGASDAMPHVSLETMDGTPIDTTVYFCEHQRIPSESETDNILTLSIATPSTCTNFILKATAPEGYSYASGFGAVNAEEAQAMKEAVANLMLNAGDDPLTYQTWLRKWQKSQEHAKKIVAANDDPTITILVTSNGSDEDEKLLRTLHSLLNQTYRNWQAVVGLPPNTAALEVFDHRITYESYGETPEALWLQSKIDSAEGDYLAFIECGDMLEPETFATYIDINKQAQTSTILYCDQDRIDAEGDNVQPIFKSKLNVDALYTWNWVGQFTLFPKQAIESAPATQALSTAGWLYEHTLEAYRTDYAFEYVPGVFFHGASLEAPYSDTTLQPESTPNLEDAQNTPGEADTQPTPNATDEFRQILQTHLNRCEIPASVENESDKAALRVRYTIPNPHPLVSIIIPNKDRIDLLESCLQSILQKSTYDNYEIVVVENNSVEEATFAFYDKITASDPRMRVEKWPDEFNYSKIINFGALKAKGEYLLLLNNDTEVIEPAFIEEMLGPLQRPEVGVVGAKLLFRDNLVQHAGMEIGVWGAVVHVNQFFTPERGGYLSKATLPGQFSSVTGACQMVRTELFNQLRGYDEAFAVGFNDVDFCLRAQTAGKLVAYTPYALLHHYEFSTRGREEGDAEKVSRWQKELDLFKSRYPEPFEKGDPYTSPLLMRDNTYYRLDS